MTSDGRILGINDPFLSELIQSMLHRNKLLLIVEEQVHLLLMTDMLVNEETQFARVLTVGLRQLTKLEPD